MWPQKPLPGLSVCQCGQGKPVARPSWSQSIRRPGLLSWPRKLVISSSWSTVELRLAIAMPVAKRWAALADRFALSRHVQASRSGLLVASLLEISRHPLCGAASQESGTFNGLNELPEQGPSPAHHQAVRRCFSAGRMLANTFSQLLSLGAIFVSSWILLFAFFPTCFTCINRFKTPRRQAHSSPARR